METVTVQVMTRLAALVLSAVMAFEGISIGDSVPRLQLKAADGKKFDSRKQLDGNVSIVTFWRLDQVYSERLLRELQTLHAESAKDGLKIVAICAGDADPKDVAAVGKKLKLEFPLLLDPDRALYAKFGVIVAPATGFVDDKGALRFYYASHRRDFLSVAQANVALLLGKISAKEHEERVTPKRSETPKLKPADPQYKLALQLLKRGDTQGAKAMLTKAWEGESKSVPAGAELGFLLLAEGEDTQALELFEKVAAEDPEDIKVLGGRGIALLRSGKENEGEKLLKEALGQGRGDPVLFYEMGLWCEKKGRTEDAASYFRRGLEVAIEGPKPKMKRP